MSKSIDVRDQIIDYLTKEERSLRWLAIKIHPKKKSYYNSLYNSIVRKWYNLSDDNLKKINKYLGTSFENTATKK